MSKKDYIKIANVLKDIRQREAKGERIAELFVDMLKADNPSFNREKFINYINA